MNKIKDKLREWYWKLYRYFFIPKQISYKIPKDERLFEYNLITKEVKKAEYKNHKGQKIMVKKEKCIYIAAINKKNATIKFEKLIDMALKRK